MCLAYGGGVNEDNMAKFIIFIAAAVLFWWFASNSFEDTFGDDVEQNTPIVEQSGE